MNIKGIDSSNGRVRETKHLPEWNPQTEFTSVEENRAFQGLPPERICLFFCHSKLKTCFQLKLSSAKLLNPLADSAQSLLFAEDIRQLHCAAGRGLLTGKGCSDGPEQLTVFDAQLTNQCHQAVMDGSFVPIGQVLQNGQSRL